MTSGCCLAGVICLTPEAVAAYLVYQHVVFALAKALMSVEPLSATEIDAVIAQMLARRALAAEQGRRAAWWQVTERVARSPRKRDHGMDARCEREQLLSQPCVAATASEIGSQ
jgi:hypothetical protein